MARTRFLRLSGATLAALVAASPALGDVKVSDQQYVRHDGGTDVTIADCSVNNRQQNEPAVSVSPTNPDLMSSGANDYCTVPTTGGTWAGFYYSPDGGSTWRNSLLPGYPTDTSVEGKESPLYGFVGNAGDPVQAWDNLGHLYYGGIAFNRGQPANGSIWVARYDWQAGPAPDYQYTTIVKRGAASPIFLGAFHDKVQLEVDRGVSSPYAGNVYLCWAVFTASPANNGVFLARSSDAGRSFVTTKISGDTHGSQFCDIAVTRNGTVYVAWRQFAFKPEIGQSQNDAVVYVKSGNGGRSFTKPEVATEFLAWDLTDRAGNPAAFGQARFDACSAADGTLGGCASPDPKSDTRDCGDGPFVCRSGYVFHRADSQVRIAADPTAAGNAGQVFIVYEASVPGTQTPTGTTFGSFGSGVGTQGSIYFVQTANGGDSWTTPTRVDPQAKGHQYFPDIDANAGSLHVVYHDSRFDTATGPPGTPSGGDFRTVPFSNDWVAGNPPGAISSGPGLDTFYATSNTAGLSWAHQRVSSASQMPQYEMFGNRDIPFHGDYNYIAASGSVVVMTWTDTRDVVAGTDPRYANGDGTDGFDVFQTRVCTASGCGGDTTPNAGGLDQNIYGYVRP